MQAAQSCQQKEDNQMSIASKDFDDLTKSLDVKTQVSLLCMQSEASQDICNVVTVVAIAKYIIC